MIASTSRTPSVFPLPRRAFLSAVVALAMSLVQLTGAVAQRYETKVTHAILIDADTGTVLFEKEAEGRMPPASMAKLMTMAVVFDSIREGRLKLDDEFLVSETAWREGGAKSGGSTMFAKLGSSIRLEDLIRGVIIHSGNDACIIIAEGLAGTEAAFSDLMNAEAKKIGLTGSHFKNATGLPDPDQYMTARDLARLAEYIIDEFPQFYKIYSETEFTWNKIKQNNRNPLLGMNIGADGLKTGFTEESGYGLAGSAVRGGQRLIVVINGAESEKARAEESRKLLDWGFRAFERVQLFDEGEVIAEARVFGGAEGGVGLVSKGPLDLLLPVGSRDMVKAEVIYDGPIPAPVVAGQEVGIIKVTTSEGLSMEAPVYAATDIGTGSLQQRALDGLRELLLGWW